ncbi:hypothetical protein V2G26_018136 [Clonostachys chloroleuca]
MTGLFPMPMVDRCWKGAMLTSQASQARRGGCIDESSWIQPWGLLGKLSLGLRIMRDAYLLDASDYHFHMHARLSSPPKPISTSWTPCSFLNEWVRSAPKAPV